MQKNAEKQEIIVCNKCGCEWMQEIVVWKYVNKIYELDQSPTKIGYPKSIFKCINCSSLQDIAYSSSYNDQESKEYREFLNKVLPV